VGILLISSDLTEIMGLSDRIACIFGGRIIGTIKRNDADSRKLGLMMGGVAAS
jgi:simple sugar transport system ATP-binding protein